MKTERIATIVSVLAVAFIAFAGAAMFVFGEPVGPTALNLQQSTSRNVSDTGPQSIDARGGNVTEVNIDALTITKAWQGYYGAISGEIALDDANNNTFYNWTLATVEGEVYATRNDTVTWSEIVCANSTHFGNEETYLGTAQSDGDSVSNTFNQQNHPQFETGSITFASDACNSTNAYVNNVSQSANWTQVLLHQNDTNTNNIIYATLINTSTTGFDGVAHDFQLLVGENENSSSIGVTTYYIWVELG